jgi:hypothetical protein
MSRSGTSLTFTNGETTLRLWDKRKEIPEGWKFFRTNPWPHSKYTIMLEKLPEPPRRSTSEGRVRS